jgi:hypothetical protein
MKSGGSLEENVTKISFQLFAMNIHYDEKEENQHQQHQYQQ